MALLISPFTFILISAVNKMEFAPLKMEPLGSIKEVGMELFTKWILPFEMISILLLIALVGVVVLAQKEKEHD
jgi:NADH-quinone oxidoreductase subunit J